MNENVHTNRKTNIYEQVLNKNKIVGKKIVPKTQKKSKKLKTPKSSVIQNTVTLGSAPTNIGGLSPMKNTPKTKEKLPKKVKQFKSSKSEVKLNNNLNTDLCKNNTC